MQTLSHLQRRIPRQRGSGLDQLRGLEQAAATVALIAPGGRKAAMWAPAEDISVRQETPITRRPDLADRPLLDQTSLVEPTIEMLSQFAILVRRRSSEMVERQSKSPIDIRLEGVLLIKELSNTLSSGERAELGGRSVLVRAANEQCLVADLPPESCVHVRRKKRADEIAEMLGAIDVGEMLGAIDVGQRAG